jgi:hypothetical protein
MSLESCVIRPRVKPQCRNQLLRGKILSVKVRAFKR